MGVLSDYTQGTITVTNGSKDFTGTGTLWRTVSFQEGDTVLLQGFQMVIDAGMVGTGTEQNLITSNVAGKFTEEWPGTTGTFPYRMRYQANDSRLSAKAQNLIQAIASGNISSIGELVGFPNAIIRFTGPGTTELIDQNELTKGVEFDAYAETLADLAQYGNQPKDFTVLVGDVGDGRSAIYVKQSNTLNDWYDPAYLTGPVGPMAPITVGDTTTTAPGTEATVTNSGTPTAPILDFGIPAGEGFYEAGDYNNATEYNKSDVIQYNGSSWIAKQATTGNPPPVLPVTSDANWQLLARAGSGGDMYKSTYDPTNQNKDVFAEIAKCVAFDIAQTKTEAEKGQARANINGDILAGFRNKLINGNFSIAQRGSSFTIASNGIIYIADRWTVYNRTNQTCTVNVWPSANFFAANGDYTPYMEVSFATAPTTGTVDISQPIENIYSLAGKLATFTFFSSSANISAILNTRFGTQGTASPDENTNISLISQSSGGNVSKYTGTVTVPTVSGKTIAGNGHWVRPTIVLTPRTTGGTYFAKASFVLGDATKESDPFSPRHIQEELSLCQRYYQRVSSFEFQAAPTAGQSTRATTLLPVAMRVTPSITYLTSIGTGLTLQSSSIADRLYMAAFPDAAGVIAATGIRLDAEL